METIGLLDGGAQFWDGRLRSPFRDRDSRKVHLGDQDFFAILRFGPGLDSLLIGAARCLIVSTIEGRIPLSVQKLTVNTFILELARNFGRLFQQLAGL